MFRKAIILLSGGIDSSVCMALAREKNFQCYALSFDYGQRHRHELIYAKQIAEQLMAVEHQIVKCDLGGWGGSLLTDAKNTSLATSYYVPARNIIFLSIALGWAEVLEVRDIFFGANKDDYENYPDCRPEFFDHFIKLAQMATQCGISGNKFIIHTPLIKMRKVEIIREGRRLGINFSQTFSCYEPVNNSLPCGQCMACCLRNQGFSAADNQF